MDEGSVYLKIFDNKKGDVLFEGKVSKDVEPHELVHLSCFLRYSLIFIKATNEQVKSFIRLQNNVELVASDDGVYKSFSGVLYVGRDDGVLRKGYTIPSCECILMSVFGYQEEYNKAFGCEVMEELGIYRCGLNQIPNDIGKMKMLRKLLLQGLNDLTIIPEEIGELSNLKQLQIEQCGIESLPKRLKDLKMLKSLVLYDLESLKLNVEDLVVFSKLKHLQIWCCDNVFTQPFFQSFWEMIKSTTALRVLEMDWFMFYHKETFDTVAQKMVLVAQEENGSIVDGGWSSDLYRTWFARNKENHEKTLQCVLHLLAIRRWRNTYNHIPKEMFRMLSVCLYETKADVKAWSK